MNQDNPNIQPMAAAQPPVAPTQPAAAPTASPVPAAAPAAKGKRILLVDDDLTLSEMYGERLKASGYDVTVVHDGEAGLAEAQKKPDLILLDIMMPKVNGLDVLKQLKASAELRTIPVILLTALIQELDKAKGIAGGAVDYYVKSEIMPGDLLKHIEQVLKAQEEKAKAE